MLRRPFAITALLTVSVTLAVAQPANAKTPSWLAALLGTTSNAVSTTTNAATSTVDATTETATSAVKETTSTATTVVEQSTSTTTSAVAETTAAVAQTAEAVTAPVVGEMTQSCGETPSFKAFAAFGDQADYAFAPGGSFEQGAAGWSLDKAQVVGGNESAGIFPGERSLFIKDRGRVVSPWFCVTANHPHFRYVTRGGEIEMEIDYRVVGDDDIDDKLVGETNGGKGWGASKSHELATKIPASKLKKGIVARIVFEAEDDVYVDNVLVDPYRRG